MIDGHTWRLEISGLVDTPLELSIEQLRRDFTSVDQYITLSCISNRVGGSLISTTKWTGIPLSEILAEAGLQDGASHLFINSRDGFYETYDLRLMEEDQRVMLVYAWNDEPLRHKHGFPLRIWIPDRYGMKQPKWIDSIEVIDGSRPGYWVERGWDAVARVKTTSVIDTVGMSHLSDGVQVVPIGGIAYSGAKGISKVQVRIDQSDWQDVQIRRPLSDTTWVIWRFDWPFEAGEHLFEVRTFEQDGTPQTDTVAGSRPSGATGIHSVRSALG
jgi:hypothetical protein